MNISSNFSGKSPNWIFAKKPFFSDDNGLWFSKTSSFNLLVVHVIWF